jgi:hypothetical protein
VISKDTDTVDIAELRKMVVRYIADPPGVQYRAGHPVSSISPNVRILKTGELVARIR